jgi:hypothetical protein
MDFAGSNDNKCLSCIKGEIHWVYQCSKCHRGVCKSCATKPMNISDSNIFVLRETYYGLDPEWDLSTILCTKCDPTPIRSRDVFVLPDPSYPNDIKFDFRVDKQISNLD